MNGAIFTIARIKQKFGENTINRPNSVGIVVGSGGGDGGGVSPWPGRKNWINENSKNICYFKLRSTLIRVRLRRIVIMIWMSSFGECSVAQARYSHTHTHAHIESARDPFRTYFMWNIHRERAAVFAVFFLSVQLFLVFYFPDTPSSQLLRRCSGISDIVAVYQSRTPGKCLHLFSFVFVFLFFISLALLLLSLCLCACVCVCDCCRSVRIFSFVRCLFLFNHIIFAWSCICCYFSLFFSRWLFSSRRRRLLFASQLSVCRLFRLELKHLFSFSLCSFCVGLWLILNIHFFLIFFSVNFVIFSHAQPSNIAKQAKHTHTHSLLARS